MKESNLIICPVYNEEETVEEFFRSLRKYYSEDILFIDDGSTDKSQCFLAGIKNNDTFLIRHPERVGYGATLKAGFAFALERGYQKIVTMDVDLQHKVEDIPVFFQGLSKAEVVLGSRYIQIGICLDAPRERLIINRYVSGLIKFLFLVKFSDPFCGFRGYTDAFLKKIHLKEKSYGFSLEVLLEIIRTQSVFKEVPIEAIYFDSSRKFLDGLDSPAKRLLYYLEIISRKRKEIEREKKVFSYQSSS